MYDLYSSLLKLPWAVKKLFNAKFVLWERKKQNKKTTTTRKQVKS